jgi:uncharacterized protein (DUF1697 family)
VTRHAVLLRAVNVGGRNAVPMARLRELAADLGYTEVATYVQSGNLVVSAPTRKAADVERAIAKALHDELGLDIDVMARTGKELAAVIEGNPFADIADDDARLLVSFLAAAPAAARVRALDREEFAPERFQVGDRCVYFWHPNGVGRSKMATVPWHRRLGVQGTSRNMRTVRRLLEMIGDTD